MATKDIVKNFTPHYNIALDKVVTSERQYKEEIKKGGYIPYEQAQEQVKHNLEKRKEYRPSGEAVAWMRDVKSSSDKKGNVKLSDRQIDFMKKQGTVMDRNNPAFREARNSFENRGGSKWI